MGEQPARSLEIEEDLTFQRHQMRFERIGWGAIALLLLIALLGLFGNGPLSSVTAGAGGDPIRVRYGRVDRKSNPTRFTVLLAPDAAGGTQARVWLDRDWAREFVVESVVPEPESVEVTPDRVVYTFAVQPVAGTVEIVFDVRYEHWGWEKGEIGLDGGPSQTFNQLVYP